MRVSRYVFKSLSLFLTVASFPNFFILFYGWEDVLCLEHQFFHFDF